MANEPVILNVYDMVRTLTLSLFHHNTVLNKPSSFWSLILHFIKELYKDFRNGGHSVVMKNLGR